MAAINWLPRNLLSMLGLAKLLPNAGGTPLAADDVVHALEAMLRQEGVGAGGAVFAAHSYGSAYASILLKARPHLVKGCVFAEPV
jgi:pimeloyl-ACP methyl ester carboxylesterase